MAKETIMAKETTFYGKLILDSALCAMAASMYFLVILPLQSYLSNSDSFTFGFTDLIYGCCLRMFCSSLLLGIILFVTRRWCREWLHLALIGLTLSGIIEAGPGAIGLPELNGDFAGYRGIARGIVDSAVLVAVFVAPLLLRRFLKGHLSMVSICLMLFTAASLFDVKKSGEGDALPDNSCVKEFVSRKEVLQCAKFSQENNVILLILDAMASFAVQDILKADARLASDFEGFVNYTQNVGMHNPTQVGVPGLLTGKYFQSARDIVKYGRSLVSHDSVICPYVKKNIPVYFNVANMALSGKGYTNRRTGEYEPVKPVGMEVFDEQMPGTFTLTLDDLCIFRILPYFFKESFLMSQKIANMQSPQDEKGAIAKKGYLKIDVDRDGQVWPLLAGSPVDKNCRQTFHVHHTQGGHVPIVYDENGNVIRCPHPQYADYCGQCKHALRKVAEMFNVWKTNGVYDASTIVIAGDHGPWFAKPGMDTAKIPPPAFPVLMLKPQASREMYAESSLPTTHANVSKVLKSLASRPMNRAEMEQILVTDQPRLFRLASSGRLKDWYVLKDGSVEFMNREDVEPALDALKSLEYGVDYGFRSSDSTIYPDFRVEGGNRVDSGGLAIAGSKMTVYIKVPEACMITLYGVTWGRHEKGGAVDLELGGVHREFKSEFNKYVCTTCQVEFVESDNDGIVKMNFKKKSGDSLHFVLTNIKLTPRATGEVK